MADCRTAFERDGYRISGSSMCQLCAIFRRGVVLTKLAGKGLDPVLAAIHSTIAATRTLRVVAECEDRPVHLHLQLPDIVG
jgi:hypothetical protein